LKSREEHRGFNAGHARAFLGIILQATDFQRETAAVSSARGTASSPWIGFSAC
jgi:hypothetical protein